MVQAYGSSCNPIVGCAGPSFVSYVREFRGHARRDIISTLLSYGSVHCGCIFVSIPCMHNDHLAPVTADDVGALQSDPSDPSRSPQNQYGPEYYRNHCGGSEPYGRTDHWLSFFGSMAEHLIRTLKPRRVLDAGCAMGFLVESFWDRGVEAWGIDISNYAISQVRKDMQPYCRAVSLTEPINGHFDLITCIEVLEHMSAEDAVVAARNMCATCDVLLFSSTPSDFSEPTHVNVQPPIYWLKLFASLGFQPDLLLDCGFLTPHAMVLRKTEHSLPEEALVMFADGLRKKALLIEQALRIRADQQEAAALRQEIAGNQAELASLRQNIASKTAEQQALQKDLTAAQTISKQLGIREQELRQSVMRAETDVGDLARRLDQISTYLSAAQAVIGQWEQRWNDLSAEVARERADSKRLREELAIVLEQQQAAVRIAGQVDSQMRADVSAMVKLIERLQSAQDRTDAVLGDLGSGVQRAANKADDILQSRIWRTLVRAGATLLNIMAIPRKVGVLLRSSMSRRRGVTQSTWPILMCDEPAADGTLLTGKIRVRGWAVSPARIDRVEISIDAGPPERAEFGLVRPDVGQDLPDVPGSTYSGFYLELDSTSLASGTHQLTIRAWDTTGSRQQLQRPLFLDHDSGDPVGYDRWIRDFEQRDEEIIRLNLKQLPRSPLISVIVPVFQTPLQLLQRAIESIIAQSYPHWQLCLADDHSDSPELTKLLCDYRDRDSRIRVAFRNERGGISEASNTALELATGEWVGLLDHDDELAPDALFYLAEVICESPDVDLIYSDEDKITEAGGRYDPFFKPDWSPDLLLSENYICHFLAFRKKLLESTGAFRKAFDGSQDYDLILRLAEAASGIRHIPRVLYHWRSVPGSTASSSAQKPYATNAAERAISEHISRIGVRAKVEPGIYSGRWRIRYAIPDETLVSIIIASGGKPDILNTNLESIFGKTIYQHYEVVIIDNSRADDIRRLFESWRSRKSNIRYIDWRNKVFNYSEINNTAARQCNSPVLLFLNDDTSVIAPGWLTAMVELVTRPEVGVVGAKLLYPDGRIQHAGVVMGIFENCGHAFKGLHAKEQHYFDFPDVIRNVSAVTGACLMTRAEVFWKVGGFDERKLAVAFNDIDLCLKIGSAGYRVVYTPYALLTHYEAFTKTAKDLTPHPNEVAEMKMRWAKIIACDPFYNPNLSRASEDYVLRKRFSAPKSRVADVK